MKSRAWMWMSVVNLFAALVLALVAIQSAQAQTFNVIHSFTGGGDGTPEAGLTMDKAGNLYGTTSGGSNGNGMAFKLSYNGSGWLLTPLHSFAGGNDGANPYARVIFGPDGSLYGTTFRGGGGACSDLYGVGCGTVFKLRPPAAACKTALCPWKETVLYRFTGGSDGAYPYLGDLVFDQAGNLYGTTLHGGISSCSGGGCGTVYKLSPSNGSWTLSVLYSFAGGNDGGQPGAGVIFDKAGNLYGTASAFGGHGGGAVFQLTPSGSGWTEKVLYSFQGGNDGAYPISTLVFDANGNLYGTTSSSGPSGGGTVFMLAPSGGSWTYTSLHGFTGGLGPEAGVILDAANNLYGTTVHDGAYGTGSVFELASSSGAWVYTPLHDFTGGSDGAYPISTLVFDANGNLYGTASADGANGNGVIFELTGGLMVSLNPASLDFGYEGVGGKRVKSTTLTNIGNATLHITSITITGVFSDDFSQINDCPASLGAGDYCAITVTFRPHSGAGSTAEVSISDDAPGSPQQVSLKGQGTDCRWSACHTGCWDGCKCIGDNRCGPLDDQLAGNEKQKSQQCSAAPAFPLLDRDLEWITK